VAWTLTRLEKGVSLMAVVKADGYGHGAVALTTAISETPFSRRVRVQATFERMAPRSTSTHLRGFIG
jgi:alanine racemase